MKNKIFKNVLVVLGGTSGERAISLESGRACIKALKKKGYKVSSFDPKIKNFGTGVPEMKNKDLCSHVSYHVDGGEFILYYL